MEADRDRALVNEVVKKIEAEERAEREQYLRSRCDNSEYATFKCSFTGMVLEARRAMAHTANIQRPTSKLIDFFL